MNRRKIIGGWIFGFLLVFALMWLAGLYPRTVTLQLGTVSGNKWNVPNSSDKQVLDEALRRFEKKHPGVRITYESGIQQKDYKEWLSRKLLIGEAPDVYLVPEEDFTRLANQGALTDMTLRLSKQQLENYYPVALSSGRYNKRLYALPIEVNPLMMCVNKDLLQKVGQAIPQSNWTLEEFAKICQAVTNPAEGRLGVTDYSWKQALIAYGGKLKGPDGATIDTPAMHQALKFINELNGLAPDRNIRPEDFDEGKVAFYPMTLAQYRTYRPYPYRLTKYATMNWTCISMPSAYPSQAVTQVRTAMLAVSSSSRQKDLACELAIYLSSDPQVQEELMVNSPGSSVLKSVVKSEASQRRLLEESAGSDALTTERLDDMLSHGVRTIEGQYDRRWMDRLDYLIQKALHNKEMNSALPSIQEEMNEKW